MHLGVRCFWYWCRVYLLNHIQVLRVYPIPTSGPQSVSTSSATRGSIVYMSWAFLFFLFGFLAPSFAQVMLTWAVSIGPRVGYPRNQVKNFATFGIPCCICIGAVSLAAATFLILLSMYGIQYAPIPSGFPGTIFTNSIQVVFWIAIGFSSYGVIVLTLILMLIGITSPN